MSILGTTEFPTAVIFYKGVGSQIIAFLLLVWLSNHTWIHSWN